jgi:hypothetical protein
MAVVVGVPLLVCTLPLQDPTTAALAATGPDWHLPCSACTTPCTALRTCYAGTQPKWVPSLLAIFSSRPLGFPGRGGVWAITRQWDSSLITATVSTLQRNSPPPHRPAGSDDLDMLLEMFEEGSTTRVRLAVFAGTCEHWYSCVTVYPKGAHPMTSVR